MRSKGDIVVREILQEELQDDFVKERSELRKVACQGIEAIQHENRIAYNLRRKPNRKYKVGDVVAIPVTQFGVGRKVKGKFLGPYKITKIMMNDRCEVMKLNHENEGPIRTTTAFDLIKPWANPGGL